MDNSSAILQVLDLPNDDGRVIILDWSANSHDRRLENLICLSIDGTNRWKASLPSGTGPSDCFIEVTLDGDVLRANTWSGWALWLDPKNGHVVRSSFVK